MKNLEEQHQKTVINWADTQKLDPLKHWIDPGDMLGDYLVHTPNGGKRTKAEAGIFKAMGQKAGFPDLTLHLAAGGFFKLHIEMKAPKEKGKSKPRVSDNQKIWGRRLSRQGDLVVVCYGADEAIKIIQDYLTGKIQRAHLCQEVEHIAPTPTLCI